LLPLAALSLLTLLLLVGTLLLGWQVQTTRAAETARVDSLATSRDAARALFSYDYRSLDKDFTAALALTTGQFRDEYQKTTKDVVTPVATQYQAVVQAQVVEAAVVQASRDTSTILVFINQATTSTRVQGQKIDQSRVRMQLRRINGSWLVDRVEAL